MSILKVARMGHPVLRQKARAVDKHELKSQATQRFIDDMIETMRDTPALALPLRRCTRTCGFSSPISIRTGTATTTRLP